MSPMVGWQASEEELSSSSHEIKFRTAFADCSEETITGMCVQSHEPDASTALTSD